MTNKIVLISDDTDFFDYIKSKLELRKNDELYTFSFDVIPEKLHLLQTALLIVNSENSKEKTLDLLNIFKENPVIISAYNEDDSFRRKCYRAGMFDFITPLIPDAEFRARMIPALSVAGILEKKKQYRDILSSNKIITPENDIFIEYESIIDKELDSINKKTRKAVFAAISPNDKAKLLLSPSIIETVILNNVRKNDIVMNFAPNKYFLILFDIDVNSAEKLWKKITNQMPEKIFAGFVQITNQKRQQIINEALNKLHRSINSNQDFSNKNILKDPIAMVNGNCSPYSNFKLFKKEFGQKIEQVITPVFYQIQQKYINKLIGVSIEQGTGEGYGVFYIKNKHSIGSIRITSPGFAKINIDITYQKNSENINTKRITIEPEELEAGLLEDLLEQFILEYKQENEQNA